MGGRDTDGQSARPASPRGNIGTPIVVDLPGKALQVALGELTSHALLEDGTVVAWGPNGSGQLGNGPMGASGELGRYPKPVPVKGMANVSSVYLGGMRCLAVRADGSVWLWGVASGGGQWMLGENLHVPTLLPLPLPQRGGLHQQPAQGWLPAYRST